MRDEKSFLCRCRSWLTRHVCFALYAAAMLGCGVCADSFRPAGLEAALHLSVPSFLAALAGTAVQKIIKRFE